MTDAHDAHDRPIPDAERLTTIGQWLRSTSLDELPELWNVLRGDMSLIGPRPLLMEYLDCYTPRQARRHDLKPGLTGLAQVRGRNDLAWEAKFEHDLWYVENCSLLVDLTIMIQTIVQVVNQCGVNKIGHPTTDKFQGEQTAATFIGDNCAAAQAAVVLGGGGHAKVVISTLRAAGWHVYAVYDDDVAKHGQHVLGVPICGPLSDVVHDATASAIIAIGDARCRRAIAQYATCRWITVVHPAACVDPSVTFGAGALVCAGVVVQADCRVGQHAIVNTAANVDHDCDLGDFSHVAPGATLGGGVMVDDLSLIGLGSSVAPGVRIGRETIVGAGAAVVDDLPDFVVAAGCPARILRTSDAPRAAA
jgi:sugar O-acyltransferase (sialic acid O-acetyltransferase NeuD family)